MKLQMMRLNNFGITLTNNTFTDNRVTSAVDMAMPSVADLKYFDKDGFELTPVEAIFYQHNGIPLGHHLRHTCSQIDWFKQDSVDRGAIVDHSMLLYRSGFEGDAREQVKEWAATHPVFIKLLHVKPKYGIDFDVDWIDEQGPVELFHLEWDHSDVIAVGAMKVKVEGWLMSMDWEDAARRLRAKKNEWQHLPAMDQNDWRARFFGFNRSESVLKIW